MDGGVVVKIPEKLRAELAKKEAVVMRSPLINLAESMPVYGNE